VNYEKKQIGILLYETPCTVQASKVWHKLTQSGVLPFMTQHLGLLTDVAR